MKNVWKRWKGQLQPNRNVQFSTSRNVKIGVFYRSPCRPVVRQMVQVFRKCYERLSTASTGELGKYTGSLLLPGLIQKGPSDALKTSSIKQPYSSFTFTFRIQHYISCAFHVPEKHPSQSRCFLQTEIQEFMMQGLGISDHNNTL